MARNTVSHYYQRMACAGLGLLVLSVSALWYFLHDAPGDGWVFLAFAAAILVVALMEKKPRTP